MPEGYQRIHRSQVLGEGCEVKGKRYRKVGKQGGEKGVKQWRENVGKWSDYVLETPGRAGIDSRI